MPATEAVFTFQSEHFCFVSLHHNNFWRLGRAEVIPTIINHLYNNCITITLPVVCKLRDIMLLLPYCSAGMKSRNASEFSLAKFCNWSSCFYLVNRQNYQNFLVDFFKLKVCCVYCCYFALKEFHFGSPALYRFTRYDFLILWSLNYNRWVLSLKFLHWV